jgi:HEAT repeat protein
VESKNSRTLFLLDGLDEVSQDLASDSSMSRFLAEILKQPNAIITSRPSAKAPPCLDLELESIGFYPEQVTEYIQMACGSKASEVQLFLNKHWLIQGLMRIPIQLDALCFSWDDFDSGTVPDTMTGIYSAIEQRLWKKDIVRLQKQYDGRLLTASDIETSESEFLVEDEIFFLEGLAFSGVHNNVVDFTSEHRNAISKHFQKSKKVLPDKVLPGFSFLRSSDPSSRVQDRQYHFIHLTFQEYFAARYFVRRWIQCREKNGGKDAGLLKCVLSSAHAVEIRPVDFLREHKYTDRYDIVWRFVVGLLNAKGEACPFIESIEAEPLDLLGPAHQRLAMHCLSEVSSSLPMRTNIESRLSEWLLFECKFRNTAYLAGEVEFPDHALDKAFREGSKNAKIAILKSVTGRVTVPQSFINHAASWLKDQDSDLRMTAIRAVGDRSDLPMDILEAVAARLEDQDLPVRVAAIRALGKRSDIPRWVLEAIVARLEDQNSSIRRDTVTAFGERPDIPGWVLQAILARLEDQNSYVRSTAVVVLGARFDLPMGILKAIIARLQDQNETVRRATIYIINNRLDLPTDFLQAIVVRLEDQEYFVRQAAIDALSRRSNLPMNILERIAARLEDQNLSVRAAAFRALGNRSDLPKGILEAIVARLQDPDNDVYCEASPALGAQPNLPKDIIMSIAARLEDKDRSVRCAAVTALGRRSDLPTDILTAIVARLKDQERHVRKATVYALCKRQDLPMDILKAIAARLEDQARDVCESTIYALCERPDLPEDILKAIAARLEGQARGMRGTAFRALSERSELPTDIIKAMVTRLEDKDESVRRDAETVLRRYRNFYRTLLSSPYAPSLYRILLNRSFYEQVSWYNDSRNSCVDMPEGIMRLPIQTPQNEFDIITKARPTDFPSIGGTILN